ncbi:MAG: EAL domain-containing protein [Proteobacteria bacterium]|nr:EAL domain-containing protein [Pseudomonadota bacterium]
MDKLDDKLFCTLVEQSTDVIVILDTDAVVRFVSPSARRSLGYTDSQLVGKAALGLIHPEDRARAAEAIRFVLTNPSAPVSVELRLLRRGGGFRTFEAVGKNLVDDPVVMGLAVTLRDITDRLKVSAELRAASRIRDVSSSLLKLALGDLSLDVLLRSALDIILRAECDFLDRSGAIFLAHQGTRTLELAAHAGMPEEFARDCRSLPFDRCSCGAAMRKAETVVVEGGSDAGNGCPGHCHANRLAIPIIAGQSPLGVLTVGVREPAMRSLLEHEFCDSVTDALAGMIRRARAEEEHKRLSSITRENPNPVLQSDAAGRIVYENPGAKKIMWQYSTDAADLVPKNHAEIVASALTGRTEITRRGESVVGGRIFDWSYHPSEARDRVHVFGRDVTDGRHTEKRIAHDAMHDDLTGLPNRNLIVDRIDSAIGMAKRHGDYSFAVLLLDLDRFKVITESLGHAAGNVVLREVAGRLLDRAGPGDTIGRLGGDEFIVVLGDARDAGDAIRTARDVIDRIGASIDADGHSLQITASVGIVLSKPEYDRAEEMLRDGDTAMYRAKSGGSGGHAVFDEEMHREAVERLRTQTDLRGAIDNGELTVHYQPVLALRDLRVRGFEALVRWRHPKLGTILPGKFISVAEETGLIVPLGEQVLRTACEQLATWRDSKLPLAWVAVNISAHQFQRSDLVPQVLRILKETGVQGQRLQLEITEGTAAQNPERAMRTMAALQEHRIRFALDDFGTGYSSMSYLKRFPIDTVKIDRSFVNGLPENQDDAAIASSVIAMSHALGLKVVAEGIENERQALLLKSLQCDEVQGFLYGKAMPADRATQVLQHGLSIS